MPRLLRNFAAYAAALAGYTVAIIASDQLGAVGGLNGQAFTLAVTRASEICIGIVCAGVVLAGTDFGGAPRRLATLFAALSAEIAGRFTGNLSPAGLEFPDTQPVRRELIRRVIALDPVIDEAIGESSRLRYHSPILQRAVDGLLAASAGWRTVAVHLMRLPYEQARREADIVLRTLPQELRAAPVQGEPARWIADPVGLRQMCEAAVRALVALPAGTPSLRLLADRAAEALAGMSHALNGLALLVDDPARPVPRRGGLRLRVPDWLPALVNAGRAFVVIGAVELFWIVTAWPNGAGAIEFAAIVVILLSPRADQAYAAAMSFIVGIGLATVFAAIITFAVLPNTETFAAFSLAIGLVMVPAGALIAQPWQTPMFTALAAFGFLSLVAPANPMSYDQQQFYNSALAIVAGASAGALSFRLLPPLSPAFRTRRLLALTLRDLRRLATGPIPRTPDDWEGRVYGRLSALPDAAATIAALAADGGVVDGYRYHPASPHRSPARSGLRAGCGARRRIARRQRDRDRPPRSARPGSRRSSGRRRSAGARPHPCNVGGAHPTFRLLRRRSARVRFTEINLFGVYVAPMSLMMVAAWVVTIGLRRFAARFGLVQHVWHPALFTFAVYMIVLSSMVLLVAAR